MFHIRQDVYPYAEHGAVTYMKPGQRIFHFVTRGGWFRGGARLNQTLVQEGLPTRAPGGSSSTRDAGLLLGAPLVLLLAGGAALVASRRWS